MHVLCMYISKVHNMITDINTFMKNINDEEHLINASKMFKNSIYSFYISCFACYTK